MGGGGGGEGLEWKGEGRGGDGMFLLASCVTWLKWYRLAVTISTMIRMVRIDGIFFLFPEEDHAESHGKKISKSIEIISKYYKNIPCLD